MFSTERGQFIYQAILLCLHTVCNYPVIPHGQLETGDNVRYRTSQQAVIECDDGYEIRTGSGKIICKEDGSWEPQGHKEFPQCKEKACQVNTNIIIKPVKKRYTHYYTTTIEMELLCRTENHT